MIVRDEEDVLARSIACALAVADEVIVVDTGSADGSAAIARDAGAKVYDFEWRDDFSAASNYSFSLASGEYIMWLDADDVIDGEDAEQIRRLVSEGGFDVAMLGYRSGDLYYFRERILRRSMNFVWKGVVHEVIEPRGRVVYSSAKIVHKKLKKGDPLRNLFIYQRHIAGGMRLDGRQQFYYGRELFYCAMYAQAIAVLEQFLRGDGWSVNKAEACRTLYYCHRALGDGDRAVSALTDAFLYLPPRAQDCCLLAAELFAQKNYACARYWYEHALQSPERAEEGGFVADGYSSFIPLINLVAVCVALGDLPAAVRYNERAGALKPGHPSYLANAEYFKRTGALP